VSERFDVANSLMKMAPRHKAGHSQNPRIALDRRRKTPHSHRLSLAQREEGLLLLLDPARRAGGPLAGAPRHRSGQWRAAASRQTSSARLARSRDRCSTGAGLLSHLVAFPREADAVRRTVLPAITSRLIAPRISFHLPSSDANSHRKMRSLRSYPGPLLSKVTC
jgi:hypothetical protein